MLCDTIDFLEREYPDRVFAIFLSAGGTCEWHNKALDLPENPVRDAHFQKRSGLLDAHLPDQKELEESADGIFRNAVSQRNAIEFLKVTNEVIVEELAYYARLVKEHTRGRLLVGAAAGYIMAGEHPLAGYCETAEMLKIPEGVLRKIAAKAGVFFYQNHGLPTYANSRMAAFFAPVSLDAPTNLQSTPRIAHKRGQCEAGVSSPQAISRNLQYASPCFLVPSKSGIS